MQYLGDVALLQPLGTHGSGEIIRDLRSLMQPGDGASSRADIADARIRVVAPTRAAHRPSYFTALAGLRAG